MSNVYGRLHAAFSSTKNPAKSIKVKPQKSQPINNPGLPTNLDKPTRSQTLNRKIVELLREKDSQILFERFKHLSGYSYFRSNCRDIYKLTIHRFALAGKHSLIEQALESQKDYITSGGFANRIMHLYGRYGMFDHAQKLFDELPERKIEQGVNCFSTLLGAAANSGKLDKVLELFRELPMKLSIKPNVDCYNAAMHALCKMGMVDDAVLLLDELESNGLKPNVISFNTLMCVYYDEDDFEQGEKLWGRMIQSEVAPDVRSYNCKAQGLVHNGRLEEAVELVMQLKDKGLKPNVDTFNALIYGFVKNGDLDGAMNWYNELVLRGCWPNKLTFCTLVQFLCEKSDYGPAFKLCKKMFEAKRHFLVDEAVLQNVVVGLAKNSMTEEAKTVVELARSRSYCTYNLALPETLE